MFDRLFKFLNYWYFRFLMVTEMYMVEKWERVFMSCFLSVMFLALFYFNYAVLLNATSSVLRNTGVSSLT